MPQARTSYTAVVSLGLGAFTLGLYLFAGWVSPFLAVMGIFTGLWAVHAVRKGAGRLNGYPVASLGILLGALQFFLVLVPGIVKPVTGVTAVRAT
jgi:hypothetical protein